MNGSRTASILLAPLLLALSCSAPTDTVRLHFEAVVDGAPLVFDQHRYRNPGGDGRFKVRSFQFYLSNVRLIGASETYAEAGSYHLARFDNEGTAFTVELKNVPRREYRRIEFSIGVDEAANSSIEPVGDLDPNSRMAWSWDVGYKFVLFEGGLDLEASHVPLVYHIGFNENYRTLSFDLAPADDGRGLESVSFKVDIMRCFTGAATVDLAKLPSVKFDRQDARLLADNYAAMVSLKGP